MSKLSERLFSQSTQELEGQPDPLFEVQPDYEADLPSWADFEDDTVRRAQVPLRITRKMKMQLEFIAANSIGRGQNDWLCQVLEPLLEAEAERIWQNQASINKT